MPSIVQRGRDAIKARLDRRYQQRAQADAAQTGILEELSDLHRAVANLSARLDTIATRVGEDLQGANQAMEDHRARTGESLARLAAALDDLADSTRPAREFLGSEQPADLRRRLHEAHRIAREGSEAIELLLQQEVLIRRDLAALGRSAPVEAPTTAESSEAG